MRERVNDRDRETHRVCARVWVLVVTQPSNGEPIIRKIYSYFMWPRYYISNDPSQRYLCMYGCGHRVFVRRTDRSRVNHYHMENSQESKMEENTLKWKGKMNLSRLNEQRTHRSIWLRERVCAVFHFYFYFSLGIPQSMSTWVMITTQLVFPFFLFAVLTPFPMYITMHSHGSSVCTRSRNIQLFKMWATISIYFTFSPTL